MSSICYITSGGVCERFPGAKFMFLEANGGWLVPWLERLDHHARKFSWDVPWLKMLPSEYFRRQCWISFDPDESMLAFTAKSPLCGADRIIWASDYPHPDAKFPGVTEELTEALEGLELRAEAANHQRERHGPVRHRRLTHGARSVARRALRCQLSSNLLVAILPDDWRARSPSSPAGALTDRSSGSGVLLPYCSPVTALRWGCSTSPPSAPNRPST